jgi:hypothetical protein
MYAKLFPGDLRPRNGPGFEEEPAGPWIDDQFAEGWAADHAVGVSPEVASLRRELRRYRYKPGYTLSIRPIDPNGGQAKGAGLGFAETPLLVVSARLPDSRHVAEPDLHWSRRVLEHPQVTVVVRKPVPEAICGWLHFAPEDREAHFARFIESVLEEVEQHEMLEWFRRDGELVRDPHAKGVLR